MDLPALPLHTEAALLAYLDAARIPYVYIAHEPVFTCEQADTISPPAGSVQTKNLFLRDDKRRFYLLMTACEKQVDLKALARQLEIPKPHFASPEDLLELLGVEPGAVTVLGLANDPGNRVSLLIDCDYWPEPRYLCHPLVNTATLVLERSDLERFFAQTGHVPRIVPVPRRAAA